MGERACPRRSGARKASGSLTFALAWLAARRVGRVGASVGAGPPPAYLPPHGLGGAKHSQDGEHERGGGLPRRARGVGQPRAGGDPRERAHRRAPTNGTIRPTQARGLQAHRVTRGRMLRRRERPGARPGRSVIQLFHRLPPASHPILTHVPTSHTDDFSPAFISLLRSPRSGPFPCARTYPTAISTCASSAPTSSSPPGTTGPPG